MPVRSDSHRARSRLDVGQPDHAVVLVYVNQAVMMGNDARTQSNSVVQVTLDRSGGQWLISGFDPK